MTKFPATARFSKPLDQEVHRILWEEWDPIGVNKVSPVDHEYERFVHRVAERLREGETVEALAKYLGQLRQSWGEDAVRTEADLAAAELLTAAGRRRDWQ